MTHSVSFIVSPFLQLKWKGKWQPDFFLHVDRLAKVDLSETCFLGHVHYAMEMSKLLNIILVSMKNILNY